MNTDISLGHDDQHTANLADEAPVSAGKERRARADDAEQLSAAYREHRAALSGFARSSTNRRSSATGGLGRLMTRWQTEHALKRMTAPQRHSVVHVHLHGRPYADVAAELGDPVGTIKSRVHVGLQAARAEVA